MASTRLCLWAAAVALAGPVIAGLDARAAETRTGVSASYGAGVHSYYAGSYQQADAVLSRVIESGGRDPRAYYFRAMTRLRLGRQPEAVADMKVGAALEAMNPGLQLSVSQALQRVQGYDRQTLEKHRRAARVALASERSRRSRARYEGLEAREPIILRSPESVPLDSLLGSESEAAERVLGSAPAVAAPVQPQPVPAEEPEALFEEPEPQPVQQTEPAVIEPADSGEGFDDIFAEPQPAEPEPAEPQPAMEDDLFGAGPETAEDPFGAADEPEPAPAADTDIFGEPTQPAEEPAPMEDDPFGEFEASPEPSSDPSAAESTPLDEESKVKPRKLMGVLGRVIGRASPFSGMSVPQLPGAQPFPGAAQPMQPAEDTPFDFGPAEDEPAAEPDAMEEDPFGDFGEPEMTGDDPFGAAAEEAAPAESMPADDDPFGSVDDDPFAGDDPFGDSSAEDSAEGAGEAESSSEETEEPEDPFDGF